MYVCLCNAYRSDEIREVAREGAETVDEAYLMLGDALCCRRCEATAQALINEERAATEEGGPASSRASGAGATHGERTQAYPDARQ